MNKTMNFVTLPFESVYNNIEISFIFGFIISEHRICNTISKLN